MSEPRSLYVNLKIKKENLERFFQDTPLATEIDQDWTSWWESRGMHSKSPLSKIPIVRSATNRDYIESFLKDPQTGTHEHQEEGQEGWRFSILLLSQNYFDILPTLAWLKGIARYMDAGDEGLALIYDYCWGGKAVMAHLVFSAQQALLKPSKKSSEVDRKVMNAANETLKKAIDLFSAR